MLKNEILNVDGTNWFVREAVTTVIARQMGRHHVRATVSNPPGAGFWEVGYVWQRPGAGLYGKAYDVTLARAPTFEAALDKARKKIKPEETGGAA